MWQKGHTGIGISIAIVCESLGFAFEFSKARYDVF
jgi:hypothetical protein